MVRKQDEMNTLSTILKTQESHINHLNQKLLEREETLVSVQSSLLAAKETLINLEKEKQEALEVISKLTNEKATPKERLDKNVGKDDCPLEATESLLPDLNVQENGPEYSPSCLSDTQQILKRALVKNWTAVEIIAELFLVESNQRQNSNNSVPNAVQVISNTDQGSPPYIVPESGNEIMPLKIRNIKQENNLPVQNGIVSHDVGFSGNLFVPKGESLVTSLDYTGQQHSTVPPKNRVDGLIRELESQPESHHADHESGSDVVVLDSEERTNAKHTSTEVQIINSEQSTCSLGVKTIQATTKPSVKKSNVAKQHNQPTRRSTRLQEKLSQLELVQLSNVHNRTPLREVSFNCFAKTPYLTAKLPKADNSAGLQSENGNSQKQETVRNCFGKRFDLFEGWFENRNISTPIIQGRSTTASGQQSTMDQKNVGETTKPKPTGKFAGMGFDARRLAQGKQRSVAQKAKTKKPKKNLQMALLAAAKA